MEQEQTLGDIYDALSDRLATVRTRAIMGERAMALELMQEAHREYQAFREVLADQPGFYALENNYKVTLATLCDESARTETLSGMDWLRLETTDGVAATQSPLETLKTRKRTRRAEQKAA